MRCPRTTVCEGTQQNETVGLESLWVATSREVTSYHERTLMGLNRRELGDADWENIRPFRKALDRRKQGLPDRSFADIHHDE